MGLPSFVPSVRFAGMSKPKLRRVQPGAPAWRKQRKNKLSLLYSKPKNWTRLPLRIWHSHGGRLYRSRNMRTFGLILFACFISGPMYAREPSGTALPALSRCAGKVGRDVRQADPAFVTIALDGRPWIAID